MRFSNVKMVPLSQIRVRGRPYPNRAHRLCDHPAPIRQSLRIVAASATRTTSGASRQTSSPVPGRIVPASALVINHGQRAARVAVRLAILCRHRDPQNVRIAPGGSPPRRLWSRR